MTHHHCWCAVSLYGRERKRGGRWQIEGAFISPPRIEIPVWGLKPLATGMTGYRENQSKTGSNSNFEFEKCPKLVTGWYDW
jgi:hypothetical protein